MIAAVLLAAGESRRMGRPKALLEWHGRPLVQYQVEQLRLAGVEEIVVVLGHRPEEVTPYLAGGGARVVVNERYREGRASSLRVGASALPDGAGPVLVLNVDQPRPAQILRTLIEAQQQAAAPITAPRHGDRRGHPPVFAGGLLPELRAVRDETRGLRAVMEAHAPEVQDVPVDDPIVLLDLNTPEDYQEALRRHGG